MTKVNVHTASREELLEAGVRAEHAEEILKLRRKGKIESVEALEGVSGIGPATLEQLRKSLDFSDKSPSSSNGQDRAAKEGEQSAKEISQKTAELGKRTAHQAAEVTREAADKTEEAARRGVHVIQRTAGVASEVQREVAHRSADATAELGRVFVDLLKEQTEYNLKALSAFASAVDWDQVAKAVDWGRVVQIQSEYLQVSLERGAQLTQRYLEVSQAVMNAAVASAQREAKKAA
jgi:competence protein ComEA